MMKAARSSKLGQGLVLGLPFAWLVLFFLIPFALVFKVSLSQSVLGQPPYLPVFDWRDLSSVVDKLRQFSGAAYIGLTQDPLYLQSYLDSLGLAALATAITLVIAYPFALAIARAPRRARMVLLILAIAPFWTSFLIRVYAWILLLKDEGFVNLVLLRLGIVHEPLHIFATNTAVVIGIVYSYLPFMILPLYIALDRQEKALSEAASDLGAPPLAVFWRVTLPLSVQGMIAGTLMVSIPAVGEFVIPDLLGGSETLMIGSTMWNDFFANRDWPTASAAAILLLALLVGPLAVYEHRADAGGG